MMVKGYEEQMCDRGQIVCETMCATCSSVSSVIAKGEFAEFSEIDYFVSPSTYLSATSTLPEKLTVLYIELQCDDAFLIHSFSVHV